MTVVRIIGLVSAAIGALLAITIIVLWTPDTDAAAMEEKYMTPQSRFVDGQGGLRVHMRELGPDDAPAIIFIHGTAASLHTWEPVMADLARDYHVIAYDQPGHGLTGPHPERNYRYEGMADGLDAVFDAAGLDRAVLVGNSMGGWIAWRDALANPDRVEALVLLDASGIPQTRRTEGTLGFKVLGSPLGRAVSAHITPRSMIEASVNDAYGRDEVVTDELVDRYWELLRYPGNRQAMGDQFRTERADLSSRLAEITAPTLILWGEDDQLVDVSSVAAFEGAIPNARSIIYEEVGHIPMEEVPELVISDIRAFLKEVHAETP